MFNLFKKENKIKELETRILILESNITALNVQKEKSVNFNETWGEGFNLKGCTFEGAEFHCKKCNKEANTLKATISDLVASPANIDDLKVDKIKTGAINVEKDSSFSTPTPWEPYKEDECIKLGTTSPVANEITFKLSSLEGDETIITINKGSITMSCNKKGMDVKGTTCIEVGKLTDEIAKKFNLGKYARR